MKTSQSISAKLKKCDNEIKIYVKALLSEIRKLQKENVRLKVKNISLDARVKTLMSEAKKQSTRPIVSINYSSNLRTKPVEESGNSSHSPKSPIKE
jgi:hypothetical protein